MKFRTNAQKKRLDVWLIFRCRACDETWNLPVFERIAIGDLAPDMFQAIAHNDPALALRHAFDHVHLARYGVVEDSRGVTVRKSRLHACDGDAAAVEIEISLARPCGVRLDRLLSCELGITRARVRALQLAGFLCVLPAGRKPLASPIADGQRIAIALTAMRRSRRSSAAGRWRESACGPLLRLDFGLLR